MKKTLTVLFIFAAATLIAQGNKSSDFETFLKWLPGEYDNYLQVITEKENKSGNPHFKLNTVIAKINFPSLGENVFYIQQYSDGNPNKIITQFLLNVFRNDENRIAMEKYSFPLAAAFRDVHLYPSKLNSLDKRNLKTRDGCKIIWKKSGDKFIGKTDKNRCSIKNYKTDKTLNIEQTLILSKDEIDYLENAYTNSDTLVYGRADKVPFMMKRVHYYDGYAIVDEKKISNIKLNDIGRIKTLTTESGDTLNYSLQILKKYIGGELRLVLNLLNKNGNEAIVSAWSEADSKIIALKNKKAEAEFYLK
ncbi:MAG: hypothetical protein GXO87_10790 [Chlorobi bacterium]|nr:hypothetical protein [Chlorobiota bacterium]